MSLSFKKCTLQEPTIYLNYYADKMMTDAPAKPNIIPYKMPLYENKDIFTGNLVPFKLDIYSAPPGPPPSDTPIQSCQGGLPYISQAQEHFWKSGFDDSCRANLDPNHKVDLKMNINESLEGPYFALWRGGLDMKKIKSKYKVVHIALRDTNRQVGTWYRGLFYEGKACGFVPDCVVTCADRIDRKMFTLGRFTKSWIEVDDSDMQYDKLSIRYQSRQASTSARNRYDYEPYDLLVDNIDFSFFGSLRSMDPKKYLFSVYNDVLIDYARDWIDGLFNGKDENGYVISVLNAQGNDDEDKNLKDCKIL